MRYVPNFVCLLSAFCFCASCDATESEGAFLDRLATRRVPEHVSGIGIVSFPISCRKQISQLYFNQAVAFLHCDELRQADWNFHHIRSLDPGCAMAWWGLAVANEANPTLAAWYIRKAQSLQQNTTERERRWINAWAAYFVEGKAEIDRRRYLTKTLDGIVVEFPDDTEATAFLVRQFLQNREKGIPIPFTSTVEVLINEVLRKNADHPIHYRRILLWGEENPRRASQSASWVLQKASSAAVVLTKTGELFTDLSRPADALSCFAASATAADRQMQEQRLCPGDVDGYFENIRQYARLLEKLGRTQDAIKLAKQLIRTPTCSPPREEELEVVASSHGAHTAPEEGLISPTTMGQSLLLDVLLRSKRWRELRSLSRANFFESNDPEIQVRHAHATGIACCATNSVKGAVAQLDVLRNLYREILALHHTDSATRRLEHRAKSGLAELTELVESLSEPLQSGNRTIRLIGDSTQFQTAPNLSSKRRSFGKHAVIGWKPLRAPRLILPDRHGEFVSLQRLRGKPVVLVFYLGAGCPHCIEQLQSFTPLQKDFQEAGIAVIAISTDSIEGLRETFRVAGAEDAIPFMLASDQQLETFRRFNAYDSQSNEALHGTFLIDPLGQILWQNIGTEPFMETAQLLAESKRIFNLRGSSEQRSATSNARQ